MQRDITRIKQPSISQYNADTRAVFYERVCQKQTSPYHVSKEVGNDQASINEGERLTFYRGTTPEHCLSKRENNGFCRKLGADRPLTNRLQLFET